MQKDGKYVYCIIATSYECNFGPIGIGGRGDLVNSIGFDGLSMVVSDHPLNHFVLNPENILAHQKVIEAVMSLFNSVIPVRFGTVAATPDEIRNLLDRRYSELSELLERFENKVEYNIKGSWRNMGVVYKEIDKENKELKKLRSKIENLNDEKKRNILIEEAGHFIEEAVQKKKEIETEEIITAFRKTVVAYKNNRTTGEAMFMNTAFLINKGREVEFDNILTALGERFKDRSDYYCTGPLPIFNFIDLRILPEKWEL
ncbi:MAG: GvpL/GvpF family gas vesicle protein [Chlorobium sp.]|nr:MAG: GvpL/GvpF family gas vesicle protein [Chlorobium sp.]